MKCLSGCTEKSMPVLLFFFVDVLFFQRCFILKVLKSTGWMLCYVKDKFHQERNILLWKDSTMCHENKIHCYWAFCMLYFPSIGHCAFTHPQAANSWHSMYSAHLHFYLAIQLSSFFLGVLWLREMTWCHRIAAKTHLHKKYCGVSHYYIS